MLQTQNFQSLPRIPATTQLRKKIQHYSFSLSDRIGKGFTSVVYKGRNDITNQIVAIKVIELKSLRDQVTRNLLQTELQCIRKINHQYLLKYIDSFETVNNCYIVTEYCEGGDLEKQLRVKGRFTQSELVTFFAQFYSGYQSFLSSGFIHRDLKPANIFLKGTEIRIADFGMVKKLSQHPKDNYNVGTPVYMPPQSMNSNIYSEKSDVWSIGVMCYQLTHGVLPWKGTNQQQLKANVQNQRIHFDTSLISSELIQFISKCLDKNPSTRLSIPQILNQPWMQRVLPHLPATKPGLTKQLSYNHLPPSFRPHTPLLLPKRPSTHNSTPKPPALHNNISYTLLTPLQNVPSLAFGQSNQNHNRSLKSQRPTMDSESSRQKRKGSFIEKGKPEPVTKKSALDYLVGILNYFRYLFKVFRKVQETREGLSADMRKRVNLLTIQGILLKQLLTYMEAQQAMLRSKDNTYSLPNWPQLVSSTKWAIYAGVVEQYCHRYRKSYSEWHSRHSNQAMLESTLAQSLKSVISQLSVSIAGSMGSPHGHTFELIEIVDYLSTVHNMQQVIGGSGWSVFVEKSPINSIIQCKCHVDMKNYQEVWGKLEAKIREILGRK